MTEDVRAFNFCVTIQKGNTLTFTLEQLQEHKVMLFLLLLSSRFPLPGKGDQLQSGSNASLTCSLPPDGLEGWLGHSENTTQAQRPRSCW